MSGFSPSFTRNGCISLESLPSNLYTSMYSSPLLLENSWYHTKDHFLSKLFHTLWLCIMSMLPVSLITEGKSTELFSQLLHLACVGWSCMCYFWENNAVFLDLLVSVDEDNSPQWRKLAWSQDCSMLACSYRFVMYWVNLSVTYMFAWLLEQHQYFLIYLIFFLSSSGDIVVFDLAGELLFTISQVRYKQLSCN